MCVRVRVLHIANHFYDNAHTVAVTDTFSSSCLKHTCCGCDVTMFIVDVTFKDPVVTESPQRQPKHHHPPTQQGKSASLCQYTESYEC